MHISTQVVLGLMLLSWGIETTASAANTPQMGKYLEENVAFSKGHVGIITPEVYIVVSSGKNELILGKNHSDWFGLPSSERQVVTIFKGRVVNFDKLPSDYTLRKATIVSFEGNEIRFVDFATDQIGFYRRIPQSP